MQWGSFGTGLTAGINNAINIGDFLDRKEAKQRTAADWAMESKPIGTVSGIMKSLSTGLDDEGLKQQGEFLQQFLGAEDRPIRPKDMPGVLSVLKDPQIADTLVKIKMQSLDRQLQNLPPEDPQRAMLTQERDRVSSVWNKDIRAAEKEEASIKYTQEGAKSLEEGRVPKTAMAAAIKQGVVEGGVRRDLNVDELVALEKKFKDRGQFSTLDAILLREQLKAKSDEKKEARKTIEDAEKDTKANEKAAKIIDRKKSTEVSKVAAGKRDPITQDEVDSWNDDYEALTGERPYTLTEDKVPWYKPGSDSSKVGRETAPRANAKQASPSYNEYYAALKKANPGATDAQIKSHLTKKGIK